MKELLPNSKDDRALMAATILSAYITKIQSISQHTIEFSVEITDRLLAELDKHKSRTKDV